MKAPGKGLTIGILLGKGKGGPGHGMQNEDEDQGEGEVDTEDGELPPGLVEAAGELRAALQGDSDEDVARALQNAISCCE